MNFKKEILYKYGPDFLHASRLYKLFRPEYSGIGHILMLHRVLPKDKHSSLEANRMMEISPDFLRLSIEFYINKGYDIISIEEVFDRINNNNSAKRFVCYTFDDGYKDTLEYAFPIFKEFDIPLTLYLTTGMPDGSLVLWWQILDNLLSSLEQIELKYNNKKVEFTLTSKSEKEHAFYKISEIIHGFQDIHHQSGIKELFSPYVDDLNEITRYNSLSWDDISKLLEYEKFTLGAHSVNHYSYKQLDDERVIDETKSSIDRIFDRTGVKPSHFAYPYGSRNFTGERESELISPLNLKTSVTSRQGSIYLEHRDYLMMLPRFHVFEYKSGHTDLFELFDSGAITALANKFQKFTTL
jgi:peptidoglycan/xylan/chitin deacetylase (PgdA/CDA1 family)